MNGFVSDKTETGEVISKNLFGYYHGSVYEAFFAHNRGINMHLQS